ncbi:MAG: nuclear transport factor 2 family protein [Rhodomicrobium sp.]
MDTENKRFVVEMWRAFSSLEPFLAEDAVWIAPPGNATAKFIGEAGGMIGRESIVQFVTEKFPRIFAREVKLDLKGVYADGDTVVIELTLSAILANNRPYQNDYCFVHTVKDSEVIEMREYMDTYNGHRMFFGDCAS